MGNPRRQAPPQELPIEEGSADLPNETAQPSSGKKSPDLGSIRQLAEAYAKVVRSNGAYATASQFAQQCGNISVHALTPLPILRTVENWRKTYARNTVSTKCSQLRTLLRFIEKSTGQTGLAESVPKVPNHRARTTLFTEEQIELAISQAPPWLRCVVMLCYDLGLRSGTASRVAPIHYNRTQGTITIDTKGGNIVTNPVSPRLAQLFALAPTIDETTPYWQTLKDCRDPKNAPNVRRHLCRGWEALKTKTGLPADLRLHDLRRTACVDLYTSTHDLRLCRDFMGHQLLTSTLDYLAAPVRHDLRRTHNANALWNRAASGGVN